MLGGARIVRLVVLQESKITADAIAPPAPHKKVSRLPWTHRANLETRTNREYAQKFQTVTTHFFGNSLTEPSKCCRKLERFLRRTILRRRFPRESLKHAIKLR